jgi:hypothetical protein
MDTDKSPARQTLLDSGSAEQAATPNPLQHVSFSTAEYAAAAEGTSSNFDTPQVRSSRGLDLLWLCRSLLIVTCLAGAMSSTGQPVAIQSSEVSPVSRDGITGGIAWVQAPHCDAHRQETLLLLDTLRAACAHEC